MPGFDPVFENQKTVLG